MRKFTDYYSATVLGTGNNNGINLKGDSRYQFKTYYKLRSKGADTYKLFFINQVDSTGNCRMGKWGDGFEIVSAYAAFSTDKENETDKTPITFSGDTCKKVVPGEEYESDEFKFNYNDEGYLCLCFNVKTNGRVFLPSTNESVGTGRIFENGKEIWSDSFALRPAFLGVKKEKIKTVGFFGDSITQGTRTGIDKYEAWTHRIGNSFSEDVSFWNLGMGWSRAYDAAADGVFLKKAAMCDEVFMCFGVNDIRSGGRRAEEVIGDIEKIKELLENYNKDIKLYLLTIPPFNMTEFEEKQRKIVNEYIKKTPMCFDIAKVLECDDIGTVKSEYMVNKDDAHPNGLGGEAVYKSFLEWRDTTGW